MKGLWLAVIGTVALSGCSTIVEGKSQDIAINTTPPGAACTLNREGEVIAKIDQTPGSVTVRKTKADINIICDLNGYQTSETVNQSDTAAAVFGNVLIGGLVGIVVDVSNGASNKYDSSLDIALMPASGLPDAPSTAAAVTLAASAEQPAAPAGVVHSTVALPSGGIVDMQRAEKVAERYRVLSRLVADGLVPESQYSAWAQQNAGAFLLSTTVPPLAGASRPVPRYEELAEFLKAARADVNPKAGEAQRQALLRALMPVDGPRALAERPPVDEDALRKWYAFLDRVRDEGLLPMQWVEAEKVAINDARAVEGLPAVPYTLTTASGAVQ